MGNPRSVHRSDARMSGWRVVEGYALERSGRWLVVVYDVLQWVRRLTPACGDDDDMQLGPTHFKF